MNSILSISIRLFLGFSIVLTLISCTNVTPVYDKGNKEAIPLPQDTDLKLISSNTGIYPDTSILKDANNPFILANVSEATKWTVDLNVSSVKSKFYLWATILARSPSGENQFYVATHLKSLHSSSNDEIIRDQALAAYRSVLDNFFDSITYNTFGFKASLNVYVCSELVAATGLVGHLSGADTNAKALTLLSEWGYYCDPTNGIVLRK